MADTQADNQRPEHLSVETIARACHEAIRAYCLEIGHTAQPMWDEASEEMRHSLREGVEHVLLYPDIDPLQNHHDWMVHRRAQGWTYGPVKDAATKQHPNLVPYGQLSVEERRKNAIFVQTVRSHLT